MSLITGLKRKVVEPSNVMKLCGKKANSEHPLTAASSSSSSSSSSSGRSEETNKSVKIKLLKEEKVQESRSTTDFNKQKSSEGSTSLVNVTAAPSTARVSKKPVRLIDELPQLQATTKSIKLQSTDIELLPGQPLPSRDKTTGELIFEDYPNFRPNLTPYEVLQAGSFGGTYFRPIHSSVTNENYSNCHLEFPPEWFAGLNIKQQVTRAEYANAVNKYKVHCGGDLAMWETSGWITSIDPYGWFQWYCRFYLGRRCSDDVRQISRGLGVFGPKGRWRNNLTNKILSSYPGNFQAGIEDYKISPVIRQLLLHWGYDLTVKDLEKSAKKK